MEKLIDYIVGMLSLVNSQRVAAGKSTLGWVNPLLYKYYDSFTNDITEGDKNNCGELEVGYDSDDYYSPYYFYHIGFLSDYRMGPHHRTGIRQHG